MNMTQLDVFSRLMNDRIIFLGTEIDADTANIVMAQLLFLNNIDKERPINLYLNTPGGSVYDGLGIYDTMNNIDCPVYTTCTAKAMSMGAVLLIGGEKGHRSALPHSRIMIHQPSCNMGYNTYANHEIELKEMNALRNELYQIMADHSGNSFKDLEKWCAINNYMSPEEALAKGFIDKVTNINRNE